MSQVLHTLRCVGTSGEERLASAVGMSAADVAVELASLSEAGLAFNDQGPFGGWSITDQGRAEDDERLRAELAATDSRDLVDEVYASFISMNLRLLQVCSDWQMRRIGNAPVLNDHRDRDYDVAVLDRLGGVHDEVVPLLDGLTARLDRFSTYGPRFSNALNRAMAGQVEALADSLDSYHAVWFQLHEDLLTTIGLSREEERLRLTGGEPE